MRKITLSLSVAVVAFTSFAYADDWSKTYELGSKPELRVEAHDANVHIEVWDQNKIDVRVTTHGIHIGSGGLEIVEHQQGNAVDIELREPHQAHFFVGIEPHRAELEIHMPRSAKVNVHTGDGAVLAKGLEGDLDFTTGDGSLEIEDVDGSLHAHTSDGRVEVEARPGSQLREAWNISSSDGSLTLRLPGDLAADIALHTSDGSITTNIPIAVQGNFGHHDIHGKMNGGGNLLTVHTSDGSVTLDKF
ncbi:MAG: DUF4097 family beta strand repeat-containing protein [Terriglobales bacterium]|jgi:DUF4097 and DUF4098 domain-containing protein YvlB